MLLATPAADAEVWLAGGTWAEIGLAAWVVGEDSDIGLVGWATLVEIWLVGGSTVEDCWLAESSASTGRELDWLITFNSSEIIDVGTCSGCPRLWFSAAISSVLSVLGVEDTRAFCVWTSDCVFTLLFAFESRTNGWSFTTDFARYWFPGKLLLWLLLLLLLLGNPVAAVAPCLLSLLPWTPCAFLTWRFLFVINVNDFSQCSHWKRGFASPLTTFFLTGVLACTEDWETSLLNVSFLPLVPPSRAAKTSETNSTELTNWALD